MLVKHAALLLCLCVRRLCNTYSLVASSEIWKQFLHFLFWTFQLKTLEEEREQDKMTSSQIKTRLQTFEVIWGITQGKV